MTSRMERSGGLDRSADKGQGDHNNNDDEDHDDNRRPPAGWDRCHAYMKQKRRFCRQKPLPNTVYCGNHRHLLQDSASASLPTAQSGTGSESDKRPFGTRKRVPCPIDPSHYIFEDQIEKHIKVCPKATTHQQLQKLPYYQEQVNTGGYGSIGNSSAQDRSDFTDTDNIDWAHQLALRVLRVYRTVFSPTSDDSQNTSSCRDWTRPQLLDMIAMQDLAEPELQAGLPEAVEHYRMKSGGERHLRQQASLVGHLRQLGVFDDQNTPVHFVEMGAGRGMLGLVAAGVAAANNQSVHLTLVERAGSKGKADTVLRTNAPNRKKHPRKQSSDRNNNRGDKDALDGRYLRLDNIDWLRVRCDLAHVHLRTVLDMVDESTDADRKAPKISDGEATPGRKRKHPSTASRSHEGPSVRNENPRELMVVVAKHLCGAGTDLALRSLMDVMASVDVCVMATCCHGVCSWNEYIGRDFLIQQFRGDGKSSTGQAGTVDIPFGSAEFEMLRKWSTGTVSRENYSQFGNDATSDTMKDGNENDGGNAGGDGGEEHFAPIDNPRDPLAVGSIVRALDLSCGVQGFGRACQRILDAGRVHFMEHQLFRSGNVDQNGNDGGGDGQEGRCGLVHYVDEGTTPQNAVLIGWKKK